MAYATSPARNRFATSVALTDVPRLGLVPRTLIFLMPVVAAANPVFPVIGPVSPFPLLAACLFIVGVSQARRGGRFGGVRTAVWLFALPMLIIALLTLALRFGAVWAHNEAVAVTAGTLVVLAFSMMRITRSLLRILFNGWLLAFLATSAVTAVEVLTGQRLGASYLDTNPLVSDFGVVSVFYNPNNYAAFISISLPILVAGRSMAASKMLRFLYAGGLLASIPLMLLTNSRFGLAAMLVFGGVWAVLSWQSVVARVIVIVLGIGAVVGVFALAESSVIAYWGNAQYTVPIFGIDVPVDSSIYARWNLAQNGLDALATNPLLGAGPGGFEIHAQNTTVMRQTFRIINPHNGVIELLSQYGVIILVLAVILTITLLRVGASHLRISPLRSPERAMAFALISAVTMLPLVLLMNSSYLEILHTWASLAVFVAIACYLADLGANPKGDDVTPPARVAGPRS
ncbi:O-antigen ligase family protein [Microbacterium sp. A8/3-1]|uniref:O-antigen ligase family protein n=1 Tax=Microbacterium sp. A8/3-1 TaxID=3160749 RepID=A0AAU7W3Y8_9MICO